LRGVIFLHCKITVFSFVKVLRGQPQQSSGECRAAIDIIRLADRTSGRGGLVRGRMLVDGYLCPSA
jgi:hypothetical protein